MSANTYAANFNTAYQILWGYYAIYSLVFYNGQRFLQNKQTEEKKDLLGGVLIYMQNYIKCEQIVFSRENTGECIGITITLSPQM